MQSYFFLKNETQYATRKLEEIRYNPGDRLVDVIPKSLCSDNLTLINHLHLFTLSELLTTIDKLGINGQTLIASEGMRSSLYDPAKLSMSHREEVSLLKCDFWIGLCEGQQFSPQGTIKQGEKLYVLQSTKDLAHADYEGTKIARMDFIIPVVNLSLEETDHSQRSFQIIIPEEAEAVYSQLPALEAMAPIDYTISELYEVSSDGTIERKEVSDEHLLSRKPQKKKTEALSNQENELSFFIKTPTGRTYVFSCDLEARFIDVIRNIFADFLGHKFVKNGKQIDLYDLPKTIRELGIQTDDIIHSIERVGYSKSLFSLLSSDKCGLRKLAFEAIYEFKVALRKDKKLSNLGHFKKGEQLSVVPAQAESCSGAHEIVTVKFTIPSKVLQQKNNEEQKIEEQADEDEIASADASVSTTCEFKVDIPPKGSHFSHLPLLTINSENGLSYEITERCLVAAGDDTIQAAIPEYNSCSESYREKLGQPVLLTQDTQFNNKLLARDSDEIISGLYLGDRPWADSLLDVLVSQQAQEQKEVNQENSSSVILRCTPSPLKEAAEKQKELLESKGLLKILSIKDHSTENIYQHLDDCFDFIDKALRKKQKVFVHCDFGMSRSPSIVAAYLIRKYGLTATEAVNHIKHKRPSIDTQNFTSQLERYANDPSRKLIRQFLANHEMHYKQSGLFKRTCLKAYSKDGGLDAYSILEHAKRTTFFGYKNRTRTVLEDMGIMDKDGNIINEEFQSSVLVR